MHRHTKTPYVVKHQQILLGRFKTMEQAVEFAATWKRNNAGRRVYVGTTVPVRIPLGGIAIHTHGSYYQTNGDGTLRGGRRKQPRQKLHWPDRTRG